MGRKKSGELRWMIDDRRLLLLPSSKNPIDITSHEGFLEVLRE